MHIIDRRLNPGGKSLVNRQRFLRRTRAMVRQAVREQLQNRSIRDFDQNGEVSIPADGLREPTLHRTSSGGNRDHILPGNKDYVPGDTIKRPGGGSGAGSQAGSGDGEDSFSFVLTRDEFLDLFLDDLELPDLAKRRLMGAEAEEARRAGYTTSGSPANLSIPRSMRNALSRRLALKRPGNAAVREIEAEIARVEEAGDDPGRLIALREELDRMARKRRLISYIDPLDLRYRRYETHPRPIAQAVIFCLMDVSGSMSEHMKELAKSFFILLYLFVSRCYRHVEIVFIRHTDQAAEVDENTFFYSRETGGTIVSTALEEMLAVVAARYRPDDWNIYVAQASDGDNIQSDSPRVRKLMEEYILPISQYVAYLEVGADSDPLAGGMIDAPTTLWGSYAEIEEPRLAMRKVHHRRDIYPVFRELFQRRNASERVKA